jgi:hypothetical protein
MKRGVIVSKAATGRLTVSFSYNQEHIAKVKIKGDDRVIFKMAKIRDGYWKIVEIPIGNPF